MKSHANRAANLASPSHSKEIASSAFLNGCVIVFVKKDGA
jgi:hypothetical protein